MCWLDSFVYCKNGLSWILMVRMKILVTFFHCEKMIMSVSRVWAMQWSYIYFLLKYSYEKLLSILWILNNLAEEIFFTLTKIVTIKIFKFIKFSTFLIMRPLISAHYNTLILFYKQHMIKKTSWTILDFIQSLLIFVA